MKERPILFSAPMVRAILEGRKTQTRRIAKEFDPTPGKMDGILSRHPHQQGCRYGKPGDRLWVRETWGWDDEDPSAVNPRYRATHSSADRWIPSIHMPRWASRITLKVESVRLERLQDISQKDAYSEGVTINDPDGCDPVMSFAELWESINGPGSWEANPWVWVVQFKRINP